MTSITIRAFRFHGLGRLALGVLALPLVCGGLALAQDAKPAKPKAAAQTGDAGLKARVDSLEEQLVDMQVLVGTLQSMARNPGVASAGSAGGSGGGADPIRVEALENQVRSLTNQVQALSDQVRSMGGSPRRGESVSPAAPSPSSFGATAVQDDAIGGLIEGSNASGPPVITGDNTYEAPPPAAAASSPAGVQTAAIPAPGESGDPRQLYETAYGYLLQRDYGAAEAAFDDFLKKFPSDSLAGNAQYWLGESFFVRGQYKAAASAFLKGYQTYAKGAKAPDSLLKLAMSLDRLGQKDAACASYAELNSKFPDAPQSVKARAQAERQRVGCQ